MVDKNLSNFKYVRVGNSVVNVVICYECLDRYCLIIVVDVNIYWKRVEITYRWSRSINWETERLKLLPSFSRFVTSSCGHIINNTTSCLPIQISFCGSINSDTTCLIVVILPYLVVLEMVKMLLFCPLLVVASSTIPLWLQLSFRLPLFYFDFHIDFFLF